MSSISSLDSLLSSAASSSSSSSLDLSSLLAAATGATSTGIDVTSAVDAAIYAEQAPEREWESQQSTLQSQTSAISSIQSALTAVTTDLRALNDPEGALASATISSSNSSAVTATASPGAAVGTHSVAVNNLATSASWYSAPLANSGSSLGSSTLTITGADGAATSFTLGSSGIGDLTDLVAAINADTLGVTASVVTDATGTRLALVSNTTGANANFSVADGSATAPTWTSAAVPSAGSILSASTFDVGDGSATATISVAAGSTLAEVAAQINNAGLNLTASVVSGSNGEQLQVSGNTGNNVTLSSDPAFNFKQSSVAGNASLSVDGIPVSSASNTVTGVIPGVTLNLEGTTGSSPASLTVSADSSQIGSAISQFVTNYNSAVSLVNSQFTYNTNTGSEGALGSDATVRSLQSVLLGIGSYTAQSSSSSSSSASDITTLGSLGITMNNDGTLSLNTTQLDSALQSNPAAVQNFFQGASLNGFASTVESEITAFSDPATGTLTVDSNNLNQEYQDLQTQIDQYQNGYIASQQTILTSMYSKAEIALQELPTTMKQLQSELGDNSGS